MYTEVCTPSVVFHSSLLILNSALLYLTSFYAETRAFEQGEKCAFRLILGSLAICRPLTYYRCTRHDCRTCSMTRLNLAYNAYYIDLYSPLPAQRNPIGDQHNNGMVTGARGI
jgi:hypothetical protein